MKQSRHPLAMNSRREMSTAALIEKAIAQSDLCKLEAVETQLKSALAAGLVRQVGQSALIKVQQAIARQKLNQLFGRDTSAASMPHPPQSTLQHFSLS